MHLLNSCCFEITKLHLKFIYFYKHQIHDPKTREYLTWPWLDQDFYFDLNLDLICNIIFNLFYLYNVLLDWLNVLTLRSHNLKQKLNMVL